MSIILPISPVSKFIISVIAAMIVIIIAMSIIIEVDIYSPAEGRISPSGRSKIIQSSQGGRIVDFFVRNGSIVTHGEPLVKIDQVNAKATSRSALEKVEFLRAEKTRILLENDAITNSKWTDYGIANSIPGDTETAIRSRNTLIADLKAFSESIQVIRSKIDENLAEKEKGTERIAVARSLLSILNEKARMKYVLMKEGYSSKEQYLEAIEACEEERDTLIQAEGSLAETNAERQSLGVEIEETTQNALTQNITKISEITKDLSQAEDDLTKANADLHNTIITSPIDGVVQESTLTTFGQVLSSGQQLMVIVPIDTGLEVLAMLDNKDIGFIKVGDPAILRVDAFPFSRYGVWHGHVVTISRDAVLSSEATNDESPSYTNVNPVRSGASALTPNQKLVYPLSISIDGSGSLPDTKAKNIKILPGMRVNVSIKTGRRRIIDYVLASLTETVSKSAHER